MRRENREELGRIEGGETFQDMLCVILKSLCSIKEKQEKRKGKKTKDKARKDSTSL